MDVDNHQVSYLLHGPNHCLRTKQVHFPEEIIVDNLKRLPVRSLLFDLNVFQNFGRR